MNQRVAELRNLFLNPSNSYKHLAILHELFSRHRWQNDPDVEKPEISAIEDPAVYTEAMRQRLQRLLDLGFGGVVVNVGHENYLEDEEQWARFLAGTQAAKELGARLWIYDERGYPSGNAGGIVLRDHPEYEAQALVQMEEKFTAGEGTLRPPSGWFYCVRAEVFYDGDVSPVDVTDKVTSDGYLQFNAERDCTVTRYDARRAFEGTHAALNLHRVQHYINVMQQEAVDYFFKVTEEQYIERLGEDINLFEAVFTDEPSFMTAYFHEVPDKYKGKVFVKDPVDENFDRLPMIAWEKSLPEKFYNRWKYDLLPELGKLYRGDSPRDRRVRHDFFQLQSEVYAQVFFASQQARLKEKGLEFSGHVLAEESIVHHIACEGNILADLKCMGIPGIDMLSADPAEMLDSIRLLTFKYGSSAAHMAGREQVMSESSEFEQQCIDKPVDLMQRRAAFALQMALGITTLASYYMWHKIDREESARVLAFWARLAPIVRKGIHIADFAVLYPARTAWAHYKPTSEVLSPSVVDEPLSSMDANLLKICRSIISIGRDFDFIDTRDLIGSISEGDKLKIASEAYSMLVIPPGAVMCPKDLERMEEFVKSGGRVLAFEPCSEVVLGEISQPPTGTDIGPGRSPAEVIANLDREAPDRVKRVSIDDDWIDFAQSAASKDIKIEPNGSTIVVRRSVYENSDVVLMVNGAGEAASVKLDFGVERKLELWNPWDETISELKCSSIDVALDAYNAMVVVSER